LCTYLTWVHQGVVKKADLRWCYRRQIQIKWYSSCITRMPLFAQTIFSLLGCLPPYPSIDTLRSVHRNLAKQICWCFLHWINVSGPNLARRNLIAIPIISQYIVSPTVWFIQICPKSKQHNVNIRLPCNPACVAKSLGECIASMHIYVMTSYFLFSCTCIYDIMDI